MAGSKRQPDDHDEHTHAVGLGRSNASQRDFELDFFGRLVERDASNVDFLRAHADNLAARSQHARALQLDRRIVKLQPDRPIPWYNLACSYAVLGLAEPALVALQRSLELGYPDFARLRRDPDLDSIRTDPRFIKLIRRRFDRS